MFNVAAVSLLYSKPGGSQKRLYRGQIQKLLKFCQKPYQQISLVILIQKKYSLTFLRRTRYEGNEEKVKGQDFGSTGFKYVKMLQFCWQCSQNARLVNTIQIQKVCYMQHVSLPWLWSEKVHVHWFSVGVTIFAA